MVNEPFSPFSLVPYIDKTSEQLSSHLLLVVALISESGGGGGWMRLYT